MQRTLTATDIPALVDICGSASLGGIFSNFEDRIVHEHLTDAQVAALRARLAADFPVHAHVFDAVGPDGRIRDREAFDELVRQAEAGAR